MVRAAARAKHRRAVQRGERERALERIAFEVLRAMTLDHAERARVGREPGRLGEHAIHHQPFLGLERRHVTLSERLFERDARVLHGAAGRLERRSRLSHGVLREGDVEQLHAARLEGGAHGRPQRGPGGRVKRPRCLPHRPQPALAGPPPHGRRDVRPHDRHHAVVVADFPALDAVEERHGPRGRAGDAQRMDPELGVLDQLGAGDLGEIGSAQGFLGHMRCRHRAGRHDRVRPAEHRYRVRSAQPI